MKTCTSRGHVVGNIFYRVTLEESRFKYERNVQRWIDVQVVRVGVLCETCWDSVLPNAKCGGGAAA